MSNPGPDPTETRSYRDPLGEAGFTAPVDMPGFALRPADGHTPQADSDTGPGPGPAADAGVEAEPSPAPDVEVEEEAGLAEAAVPPDLWREPDPWKDADPWRDADPWKEPEQPVEAPDPNLYPAVEGCYTGFYQRFDPDGAEGRRFLVGAEGIIGAAVATRAAGQSREVLGLDGRVVGVVDGDRVAHLNALEQDGWVVECRLALSIYHQSEKSFSGELAWMAYTSAEEQHIKAIQGFIKGISSRIAFGMHPSLELDQSQFARVLRSQGQWDQTKELPLEPLERGSVTHKRRRSMADWLVAAALEHRIGCNIASWAFLAAMAISLILLLRLLLAR